MPTLVPESGTAGGSDKWGASRGYRSVRFRGCIVVDTYSGSRRNERVLVGSGPRIRFAFVSAQSDLFLGLVRADMSSRLGLAASAYGVGGARLKICRNSGLRVASRMRSIVIVRSQEGQPPKTNGVENLRFGRRLAALGQIVPCWLTFNRAANRFCVQYGVDQVCCLF